MKRRAVLVLILTNKEALVGCVKLKSSLGCSDHKMVQFRIQRTVRMEHNKLATLDFGRADFVLFRGLAGRVSWDKSLEGRGTQKSCLMFKDHFAQGQEQCIPAKTKSGKNTRRPAWVHK